MVIKTQAAASAYNTLGSHGHYGTTTTGMSPVEDLKEKYMAPARGNMVQRAGPGTQEKEFLFLTLSLLLRWQEK